MKKILVIGSNSFSGSHFVDYVLKKKYKVFGLSRSKEPSSEFLPYKNNKNIKNFIFFYKFNLNSPKENLKISKLIKKNKIQNIVNFASQGMVEESFLSQLIGIRLTLLQLLI